MASEKDVEYFKGGQFYVLMKPTDTQFLVVICDHGVENDAVFGTEDLDLTGRIGWVDGDKKEAFIHIP